MVPVLDPLTNKASADQASLSRSEDTVRRRTCRAGTRAYWGDEPIWDGHTSIHNPMMDEKGRVWFTARIRPAANPDFCKAGSDHPSAKVAPLNESARQLSMYDPKTGKWSLIDTCFTTQHLYFAKDANNTLWTSAGRPAKRRGRLAEHQDVRGRPATRRSRRAGHRSSSTPTATANATSTSRPISRSIPRRTSASWRHSMAFSRARSTIRSGASPWTSDSRASISPATSFGWLPGPNPSQTALAEVYLPPDAGYGSRGIDLDLNGVVWTTLSSGHLASFDRRKCKGPLNGPAAATGKHCPEGWTLYQFPGPQFKGVTDPGSADHAYYVWVDRYNTLGLGANVPIASTNGGESLLALVNGKFVSLRVPYPMGFFSKNVDGRIDDPNTGWKGRGLWTTFGTRTVFHNEGGTESRPKVLQGSDASRSARAVRPGHLRQAC